MNLMPTTIHQVVKLQATPIRLLPSTRIPPQQLARKSILGHNQPMQAPTSRNWRTSLVCKVTTSVSNPLLLERIKSDVCYYLPGDPRVDSDRDYRGTQQSTIPQSGTTGYQPPAGDGVGTGYGAPPPGAAGTTGSTNYGPHSSNLANKVSVPQIIILLWYLVQDE